MNKTIYLQSIILGNWLSGYSFGFQVTIDLHNLLLSSEIASELYLFLISGVLYSRNLLVILANYIGFIWESRCTDVLI